MSSITFMHIIASLESSHKGLLKDIIRKRVIYNDTSMRSLEISFNLSFYDTYRILYEVHYENDKLKKRPFSKLKKDIYDQY